MDLPWPVICTAVALLLLLVLIIRCKLQAFVALIVVSIGLGLAAGLPPLQVLDAIGRGVGNIMGGVAVILALGAMLGRMLDVSGAAQVIARTLIHTFGVHRASFAILVAAYLVGIPVLFNVGFLLLLPIMWQLQRETGRSLLWFVLPLAFSLATAHSLIPPHPGIVGAVNAFAEAGQPRNQLMIQTILFGTLMGVPVVLIGWFGPGRLWASQQMVTVPENLAPPAAPQLQPGWAPPSFWLSLLIVVLPLVQSLLGFGAKLLGDLKYLPDWMTKLTVLAHSPVDWLQFIGHPTMALLVPTGLAFLLLGWRRGLGADRLAKIAGDGLQDVGSILFLFGAAGGFMEVIKATGAGEQIAYLIKKLPVSNVLVFYLVSVLMRAALGSATAAILLASSLLAATARSLPGQETLLVLAVANGVTFMTQPADSGFWMVKEYCNLSVRDVLVRFNSCRITMSLTGLLLLLAYEAWLM
jgi:gluconate transporter